MTDFDDTNKDLCKQINELERKNQQNKDVISKKNRRIDELEATVAKMSSSDLGRDQENEKV